MQSFQKNLRKFFYSFIIFAILIFMQPINSYAATKTISDVKKVVSLEENTIYKCDLDGDGKKESLQYKLTVDEEKHTVKLKLYINSKVRYTKTTNGITYWVSLFDLHKDDNRPDLFIQTKAESDTVTNALFAHVNQDKSVNTTAFNPDKITKSLNFCRYSLYGTDGSGNFTLSVDTPIYSPAIGCYYCYITFQDKGGKISLKPANTFKLEDYSKKYCYKAAKGFSVYKKAGSKAVAYKVEKGSLVTFDQMYLSKTGKAYFRIINGKGKKGWIPSDLENLFTEIPAWG